MQLATDSNSAKAALWRLPKERQQCTRLQPAKGKLVTQRFHEILALGKLQRHSTTMAR